MRPGEEEGGNGRRVGGIAHISDAEFLSVRLARVARLVGYKMPDSSHATIAACAGTILGGIASILERRAAPPAAPGSAKYGSIAERAQAGLDAGLWSAAPGDAAAAPLTLDEFCRVSNALLDHAGEPLADKVVEILTTPTHQPGLQDADPLQGAANWLVQALDPCATTDIASRLRIGYNRALRLHDAARAAQAQGGNHG